MTHPRVVVIGAGLAGLAAAYDLSRSGFDVTVLEAGPVCGGLASSLDFGGTRVERFYHFICAGDSDLIDLVGELGLSDRLSWRQARTSFFHDGTLYRFGSPLDLLRFKPVPFLQRIRFGVNVASSHFRHEWRRLDRVSAYDWLVRQIGRQAYEVIWDPLLRIKFGDAHRSISAAWIWHRIHRVARSRRRLWERERFGFLEHGSATVVDALLERLDAAPNARVRTSAPVERILCREGRVTAVGLRDGEAIPCRYVVSTVALPRLVTLAPDLPEAYRRDIGAVEYLGVVCGLLRLKHSLTDSFWVNINDPAIPFNGVIEYSNLNDHPRFAGAAIAYVPHYLRESHPRFAAADEDLRAEFEAGFARVNPRFSPSWVEECVVSRARYAQAICDVGFAARVPDHETPIDGLLITDSTQYYPEDRTISAAIRLGRTVARRIVARQGAGTGAAGSTP